MRRNYICPKTEFAKTGIYEFTKHVTLEKAESYTVKIFTTGRYTLYINGKYICEGPCKSDANIRYYDCIKTDALQQGDNEIKVIVLHMTNEQHFTTVYHSLVPMLLFEAMSESNEIASDESWKCVFDKKYRFYYPKGYMLFLPPAEEVDYHEDLEECELMLADRYDFEKGMITRYGLFPRYLLQERPIPMIIPQKAIEPVLVKQGEGFVEFDAGKYVTAKVEIELAPNTDANIIFAECYQKENGKERRDDSSGFLDGFTDIVHIAEKQEVYSPFWYRAFRFIRIETENPKDAVKSIRIKLCHYPLEMSGKFKCSDNYLNRMYEVSINTMLCCMHETFMDCPHYEQQQYIMDSAIESSVLMRMSSDTRLIKKCILEFSNSQIPCGLLKANYPSTYTQIIPGFSLFWIFMIKDYLDYTKDITFVKQFISDIDKILAYFDREISEKGYIGNSRYWDFVDWVPGWERGIPNVQDEEVLTVYNLYYACALLQAADICNKVGREGLAKDYQGRYAKVCDVVNTYCYDAQRGLYKDGSVCNEYSFHTVIWAILAGLATGSKAEQMIEQLKQQDMRKSSFSMNYYLFRALDKCGQSEKIFDYYFGWKQMLDWNCTTWCENPDSPRSECHAWSSAPLYDLTVNVLGVKCSFEDEIVIEPMTLDLTFAEGVVPTRFGDVKVAWQKKETLEIEITAPEGVKKKVILPDRTEEWLDGETKYFK